MLTSPSTALIGGRSRNAQYEPLLLDNERDAVADLLQYLESEYHAHLYSPYGSLNQHFCISQTVPRQTSLPETHFDR